MLDLEALKSVEIFKDLTEEEMGTIYRLAKEMNYKPGEIIVRESAAGGMLHVILEGNCEVRKKAGEMGERAIAILGEGSVFGEMSLFDGFPYSASVAAKTPTRTLSMFRNDFLTLAEENPKLAFKVTMNLISTLSHKLRKTNENLITFALMQRKNESI